MARIRTTPESTQTIHMDTIENFGVRMYYDSSGATDISRVKFEYTIANRDADGNILNKELVTIPYASWPVSIKNTLKEVHDRALMDAQVRGLTAEGTDTSDI